MISSLNEFENSQKVLPKKGLFKFVYKNVIRPKKKMRLERLELPTY